MQSCFWPVLTTNIGVVVPNGSLKSMYFSKFQGENFLIQGHYHHFVTSYLYCVTANCIFAFQILKCALVKYKRSCMNQLFDFVLHYTVSFPPFCIKQ